MPRLILINREIEIGKYRRGNLVARGLDRDDLSLMASSIESSIRDY